MKTITFDLAHARSVLPEFAKEIGEDETKLRAAVFDNLLAPLQAKGASIAELERYLAIATAIRTAREQAADSLTLEDELYRTVRAAFEAYSQWAPPFAQLVLYIRDRLVAAEDVTSPA